MGNYSYSVKSKIRTDKKRKDGTCPIIIQVIWNRKHRKLTLKGEYIKPKNWNKARGRAIGKGFKSLNDLLDKKEQDIKDFIRELKMSGETITLGKIRDFWTGNDEYKDSFLGFYDSFCDRHFKKIKPSTQKHYITFRKKIIDFQADLKLSEINLNLMLDFKDYLEETGSGVYNMLKCMKAVLNYACQNDIIKDETWRRVKKPSNHRKRDYLNKKQIKKLIDVNLSKSPRLQEVRDMFLFSLYTAARHCDVIRFTKQNFENGVLKFRQQKTGVNVQVPLKKEALAIYKRYSLNKKDNEALFSEKSNTITNRRLKKIISLSGIKKDFSYHIVRHTFASTLANRGVNQAIISQMMGHTQTRQTFTYTHANLNSMRESLNNSNFI